MHVSVAAPQFTLGATYMRPVHLHGLRQNLIAAREVEPFMKSYLGKQ